jgi:hypothetical protein
MRSKKKGMEYLRIYGNAQEERRWPSILAHLLGQANSRDTEQIRPAADQALCPRIRSELSNGKVTNV